MSHLMRFARAWLFLGPRLSAACGIGVLFLLPAVRAADYTITAASPENIDFAGVNLQPGDTIELQAHTRSKLVLRNITQGTAENPIVITNVGGQFVIDNTTSDKGLHFYNCRHIVVRGTPAPGLYDYGIKIARVSIPGGIGMAFILGSTDFAVSNVEIGHTGFAGLMAKSDNLNRTQFTMRNVSLRDLYVHDTGGEGLYVGSSFYHSTTSHPHEIHGLEIAHVRVENAGWDGIQVGCATQDVAIHDNTITGYGLATSDPVQNEGMRINPGTAGRIYNNRIEGGTGTGIFANPYGDSLYCNNVIVAAGEAGIVIGADFATRPGARVLLLNNTIVSAGGHGIEFWSTASADNVAANNLIAGIGSGQSFLFRQSTAVDLADATNLFLAAPVDAGFIDAANGDFRLAAGSPAVDAGGDYSAAGVTFDHRNYMRPYGAGADIGAFERIVSLAGEPVIAIQPADQAAIIGDDVAFDATVLGTEPFAYQWLKDSVPISGGTGPGLSLPAVTLGDAGEYSVTISNALGSVTSRAAQLTVSTGVTPTITVEPAGDTVFAGVDVQFTVAATGTAPLNYQWSKDGVAIAGATEPMLVRSNVQPADAGDYTVTVANAAGAITSAPATLTVQSAPPPVGFAVATIVSDATVAATVNQDNAYTHAINLGANAVTTVNGVAFGFGTGNGGGAQPAKGYTLGTFNNAITTFNATATGEIRNVLTSRATHTSSATYSLTLSGLSPGTAYTLALFTDSSHGPGRNWYRISSSVDATTFDLDFSAAGVNSSRMTTVTYTPTESSATFTLTRLDGMGSPGVTSSSSWVGFAGFVNSTLAAAPAIITPPSSRTVEAGSDAVFTVVAAGAAPLAYQWTKDGVELAGATGATLALPAVQASAAGSYAVTVSNALGSVTSAPAGLTVTVPRQTAQRATAAGQYDFNYLLYLPPDYNPAGDDEWPLLVFLHGYGERSTNEADPMDPAHLAKLRTLGPPKRIDEGTEFPFLVVSPQCSGAWWSGAQLEQFIQDLVQTYRVDRTRICLTGLSMGGFGVYDLAQRQPSRYAAIAPISAAPQVDAGNSVAAPKLRDLPLWAFHGANDPLYSVANLQAYLDLIRNAGGNPLVTLYTTSPGNGHDAWVPAYADDQLYAWLLGHTAQAPAIETPPQGTAVPFGGSVTLSVAVAGRWPFTYQWTRDGSPVPGAISASLALDGVQFDAAGDYRVTVTNGVGSVTSVAASVTVTKLPATVEIHGTTRVYDGIPQPVSVTTVPAGLAVTVTYDGGTTIPVDAGDYAVTATIVDPVYVGTTGTSLVISRATPQLVWNPPEAITYGTALGDTQLNAIADVPGSFGYTPAADTVLSAGAAQTLAVSFQPTDAANYRTVNTATTITVSPAVASITFGGLHQSYDGQLRAVTVATSPIGLPVEVTYDGNPEPPVLPGAYAVQAKIEGDPNHVGAAEAELKVFVTALVRRAPVLNGSVDGSVQVLTPESITLNGSAWISADLLVPGTPAIHLNGRPDYGGLFDGPGAPDPTNHSVTLNGGASIRHIVRRVDPLALPAVASPSPPSGSNDVTLNHPEQGVSDWSSLRHLTLNGGVGAVSVPPGAYGNFTANGGAAFVLGLSGAESPVLYELQRLTLNGDAELVVVGPVVLILANGASFNGWAGADGQLEWLDLRISSGGLTLNGGATLNGIVTAPEGAVVLNGRAILVGRVASDRLTVNGQGVLTEDIPDLDGDGDSQP